MENDALTRAMLSLLLGEGTRSVEEGGNGRKDAQLQALSSLLPSDIGAWQQILEIQRRREEPPPTARGNVEAFLGLPAYEATVVIVVSIGMAVLVHETNQRAKNAEIEDWAIMCTRGFLFFSVADVLFHAYVARTAFFASAAHLLDLVVVAGDVTLEVLVATGNGDNEMSWTPRLRSLRALRALRGIRACCACRELDIMVRRMSTALRAIAFALLMATVMLAAWAAVAAGLATSGFGSSVEDGSEMGAVEDSPFCEGCTPLEHSIAAAMVSAQETLVIVAKLVIVGDIWDVDTIGASEKDQWTAISFLALVLGLVVVKTVADARAEAATVEENDTARTLEDIAEMEGSEPSLEQLRSILFSVAAASNALGEQMQLFRRRRDAINGTSGAAAICHGLDGVLRDAAGGDGDGGVAGSASASAVAPGDQFANAFAQAFTQAHPSHEMPAANAHTAATSHIAVGDVASATASAGAVASTEGAADPNGRGLTASRLSRLRGGASAASGGFAASRSAAAAAAAAAAGLELTLAAEEMVRTQFAELRRHVEREVTWRCGLGLPVSGGGFVESAALGAARYMHGVVPLDGYCSDSDGDDACVDPSAVLEDPADSARRRGDVGRSDVVVGDDAGADPNGAGGANISKGGTCNNAEADIGTNVNQESPSVDASADIGENVGPFAATCEVSPLEVITNNDARAAVGNEDENVVVEASLPSESDTESASESSVDIGCLLVSSRAAEGYGQGVGEDVDVASGGTEGEAVEGGEEDGEGDGVEGGGARSVEEAEGAKTITHVPRDATYYDLPESTETGSIVGNAVATAAAAFDDPVTVGIVLDVPLDQGEVVGE
eukprot:TRINITY_DN2521_c0_g1_i1.p1 TRINITY_DN2521_c0_g1~~TRINITY_DN2521_c0_g1_i1.p1  ORF type:complete len:840 (+),score=185.50 TRINITY_DN2521_c0_g1_i1:160-2679(+)